MLLAAFWVVREHWHQRAFYYFSSRAHASEWRGRSVWLPDYRVSIDAKPVRGIASDLSAIAYDSEHDRLLGVTNGPGMKVVELSKSGELLAEYPMSGFQDVEGLTYMGNGLVAVVDENYQQLDFFLLPQRSGQVIEAKDAQFLALNINPSRHNKGFEGVSYDAAHDRLYVVKERDPRQLYEIAGVRVSLGGRLQIKVTDRTDWVERSVFGTDISDVSYDPRSGHLLILSEESRLIMELDDKGGLVSYRNLLGHLGDLRRSTPQAEGLTLDADGNLYVVSEPNLFYRFEKR